MSYHLEYLDSGFHLSHKGEISIGEINEVNGEIHDSKHFGEHRYQLIDLLEADFSEICKSHSNLPGTADAVASFRNEEVRVAIVAKDEHAIDFCKQYIDAALKMGSSWKFDIFADVNSALKWAKGD